MRVIGGTLKGRRLSTIKADGNMGALRPTTDRIKRAYLTYFLEESLTLK